MTRSKRKKPVAPVPRWIVWPGKLLNRLSEDWAAAYMRFFFKRPPRPRPKPEALHWRDKARQSDLYIPAIGKTIKVYEWPNEGPAVLVVHGWGGHGTSLWKLIEALAGDGYRVISFDAPAHGQSPTRSTLMKEFIEAILALDRRYGPFHAVIGHSMGGISALNATGSHGLNPRKLVLVSIPDSIEAIFYKFARALGLTPGVARKNIEYLEKVYGMDIHRIAGAYNAARTPVPTLVIHDRDDKEVPYTDAEAIAKELPRGEQLLTEGYGHRRIIRNPVIIGRILEFIRK